ncbi:baseplate J/gp47 family protein [Chitinophaga arvensicola]|uniref:Baseplate J-like protein n=1 Tax=Chitinophaga arvensicola TaxID=29529 RepID=A0A1I0R9Q5_9BACT|nr:baseplate J/gp47 family protein [Chitinophaga arvensicola]SEW37494.1 Baseplate J-like protein [Chitinophaga arvensicola]
MALDLKPSTSLERRLLFLETLINSTDKVTKVSDNSVLSGIATGIAKITGKGEKDIVLALSQLFPDSAFSDQLDQVAKNFGVSPRMGKLGSTTYVRVAADPGTSYFAHVHFPFSSSGIRFEFEEDFTIGNTGFAYARVRSLDKGEAANVDPLTISRLAPSPSGHLNIVNEVGASFGRDVESDEFFRIRIKNGANILARGTIAMLEQVFIAINPKVLKVFHYGNSNSGKVIIAIATQDGSLLSDTELDSLMKNSALYFSLTEYKPFGSEFYGLELKNVDYAPIDVSFRVELDNSVNPDDIRKDIQVAISRYLDFRSFDTANMNVEWDNLLQIVKNTRGVKYVPDQYFYPRTDLKIDHFSLPRLRGFLMLNIEGQVIRNFSGTLSPVYYPAMIDHAYMSTILDL